MLNRNTIWAKPTINAAMVMKPFSVVADCGTKAISPISEERDPEVKLAERLVQHSPGDLRVPVVDRTENHENGRHAHHHVKVGDNKHGVGQRNIHDWVAEE